MESFYRPVLDRFLRYVQVNTESVANCSRVPTSECQFDLAEILERELKEIGAADVWLDRAHCIVYATVPCSAGLESAVSTALIAHMDTAPDVSGNHVHPWVLDRYDGRDIVLNEKEKIVLRPAEFPNVLKYVGQDLVLTDGTTLLGGDDKAAVAEIMTLAEYLLTHPEVRHGTIRIAFTPDEEVGGLARDLDFGRLGAEIAYTVDGDCVGYYSDETFNATEAQLSVHGKNVHPGTAKGKMKNAIEIAAKFMEMLPPQERPQYTEGREGFYHPHGIRGNVEACELLCLIRDHDEERFNDRIQFVRDAVAQLNREYGEGTVELRFANGYLSMKKTVDRYPFMMENLVGAIRECGVEPYHLAFRGGTDGSSISQRGLPCPNLSAGYENGHSRYEFVPVQSMVRTVEILIRLSEKLGHVAGGQGK